MNHLELYTKKYIKNENVSLLSKSRNRGFINWILSMITVEKPQCIHEREWLFLFIFVQQKLLLSTVLWVKTIHNYLL